MSNSFYSRRYGEARRWIWAGRCVVCGSNTFFGPDGNAEPGGVTFSYSGSPEKNYQNADTQVLPTEHLAYPLIASDWGFSAKLPPVPQCYLCNNDHSRHERAVKIAKEKWSKA